MLSSIFKNIKKGRWGSWGSATPGCRLAPTHACGHQELQCFSPIPRARGGNCWCRRKDICWAPHHFSFGTREMWFTMSVMDSQFSVHFPSCPSAIDSANLHQPLSLAQSPASSVVPAGGGGKKASRDIYLLSSLIKELMRFTPGLLWREPITALSKGGADVWGFLLSLLLFVQLTRFWFLYQVAVSTAFRHLLVGFYCQSFLLAS